MNKKHAVCSVGVMGLIFLFIGGSLGGDTAFAGRGSLQDPEPTKEDRAVPLAPHVSNALVGSPMGAVYVRGSEFQELNLDKPLTITLINAPMGMGLIGDTSLEQLYQLSIQWRPWVPGTYDVGLTATDYLGNTQEISPYLVVNVGTINILGDGSPSDPGSYPPHGQNMNLNAKLVGLGFGGGLIPLSVPPEDWTGAAVLTDDVSPQYNQLTSFKNDNGTPGDPADDFIEIHGVFHAPITGDLAYYYSSDNMQTLRKYPLPPIAPEPAVPTINLTNALTFTHYQVS